jgi:hypothetical protein
MIKTFKPNFCCIFPEKMLNFNFSGLLQLSVDMTDTNHANNSIGSNRLTFSFFLQKSTLLQRAAATCHVSRQILKLPDINFQDVNSMNFLWKLFSFKVLL